jgi:hypothetical protein
LRSDVEINEFHGDIFNGAHGSGGAFMSDPPGAFFFFTREALGIYGIFFYIMNGQQWA